MSNGNGAFSERARELGIGHSGQGRGVVCSDFDRDGKVDIFVAKRGPYRLSQCPRQRQWLARDRPGGAAREPAGDRGAGDGPFRLRKQVPEVRLGAVYLSQGPPTLHFGPGPDRTASIEVHWPGPGGRTGWVENTPANRGVTIRQPRPEGTRLSVAGSSGSGLYPAGTAVPIEAGAPAENHRFSHWSVEEDGILGDPRAAKTVFTVSGARATVVACPSPVLASRSRGAGSRCRCGRSATISPAPPSTRGTSSTSPRPCTTRGPPTTRRQPPNGLAARKPRAGWAEERPFSDDGRGFVERLERPGDDARLWRYADCAKLVPLLDRRALFLARADRLAISSEGRCRSHARSVSRSGRSKRAPSTWDSIPLSVSSGRTANGPS